MLDPQRGGRLMGIPSCWRKGRVIFIGDTNITEMPEADDLVQIAMQAARTARRFGVEPRLAFTSYSTFGNPPGERMKKCATPSRC